MECRVCGHKHRILNDLDLTHVDTENFIRIEGDFTIEAGDYHGSTRTVDLFACPKCSTVQMVQ